MLHSLRYFAPRALGLLTAAAALAFGPHHTQAQVSAYSFAQATGTYAPITGGTVLGNAASDDQQYNDPAAPLGTLAAAAGPGLPVGFAFTYAGAAYDRIGVNTNGWLALGSSADGATAVTARSGTGGNYAPIGAPALTLRNVVGAFTQDLAAQATAELRYQTVGTAPARTLVVQWTNFARAGVAGESFSFQIRLNEANNTVVLAYGPVTTAATVAFLVQAGLRGATSADFNARTAATASATAWTASAAASASTAALPVTSVSVPPSGLTYTFAPPAAGACLQPTSPVVSNITQTGATLSFAPSATAVSYTVTITPQGGAPTTLTPAPTASPVALTGLAPGTTYAVTLGSTCAGGATSAGTSAVTFTTVAPPPANDECAGALPLPVSATCTNTVANTTGATISSGTGVPAPSCGAGPTADVWYRLVVPAGGSVTVTTSAAANSNVTDTVLELYSGACGSLTSVGCNDDINGASNTFSSVVLTGQAAGSTLYARARVFGATGTPGRFSLCAYYVVLATRAALAGQPVNLSPNPARSSFALHLPALSARPAAVAVLNALGQVVRTRQVATGPAATDAQIDVAGLPAGLYTVRVAAGSEVATLRLSVE